MPGSGVELAGLPVDAGEIPQGPPGDLQGFHSATSKTPTALGPRVHWRGHIGDHRGPGDASPTGHGQDVDRDGPGGTGRGEASIVTEKDGISTPIFA